MERIEELLLNFALNWCSGKFYRRVPTATAAGPYKQYNNYIFATDDYFKFIQWLRDSKVVVVKPGLPSEFLLLQHRLTQRHVLVDTKWPPTSKNIVGIFSNHKIIQSLRDRHTILALVPSTVSVVQDIRDHWKVRSMERLDLMWMKNARFKDFMRRNLERAKVTTSLTPANFMFLSEWLMVELYTADQSRSWYQPLNPVLSQQQDLTDHKKKKESAKQEHLPQPDLEWLIPDGPDDHSPHLPPPLTSTFVAACKNPHPPSIPEKTKEGTEDSTIPSTTTKEYYPTDWNFSEE